MGDRTDEADRLSREGREGKAVEILLGVLAEDPGHATAALSYARILDALRYEREAIVRYEQAISGGLPEKEMEEATINLGNSYRAVGEPAKAVEALRRGLETSPQSQILRVFLTISLHEIGDYREGTTNLVRSFTEVPPEAQITHQRAIDDCANEMVWDTPGSTTDAVAKEPSDSTEEKVETHHESLRGAIRRRLLIRGLIEHLPPPPAAVVDVGGGAGRIAIPLAKRGYKVTILDISEEALGRAREALGREDAETQRRVQLVLGRGEEAPCLLDEATFDAVTCHGVLPSVEDPEPLLQALVKLVRPGGLISVLAKNAEALAMRPALQGRYRKALGSLNVNRDEGPLGTLTRADTVAGLQGILEAADGEFIGWHGVRCFTDHLGDAPAKPETLEEALELEWEVGRKDPYRGVARWIHLLGRRATR